ncbi:MAG: ankyrin repeat domain-containing protein [Chloroflexi bacterium]|nr:MAG: ankyrin repeat domain-containing protein [Chloroflexota bacterium]
MTPNDPSSSIEQLADAAISGDEDTVRRRLATDSSLARQYTEDGWTTLHLAATPGMRSKWD